MKNLVKIGVFSLFLLGFGVISPNVHAESGDTYTVNFVTNGGGTVDSQTVEEGEMLDVSVISVHKDFYTLTGWYISGSDILFDIENTPVTGDLILYAKWRPNRINIFYYPNGGVDERKSGKPLARNPLENRGGNVKGDRGVAYLEYNGTSNWNVSPYLPDYSGGGTWSLSKRGYIGHNWWLVGSTGEDAIKLKSQEDLFQGKTKEVSSEIANIIGRLEEFKAGDITGLNLYADWTLVNYTLTYTGLEECTFVDGENPTTYTVLSGDITLNNPSKTGYTFLGWSGTDIEGLSTGVVITGDSIGNRVFEAVWQINSYSITYDIDGSNKIIVTGDYNTGVVQPQDPVRNGYRFLGWDTETPANMPADNIVITAKWEKLGYSGAGRRSSSTKDDSVDGSDKIDDNKKSEDDSKSDDTGNQDKNSGSGTGNSEESDGKIDMDDLMNVYLWARDNGITTGETLEAALPDGYIERGEMAKLVVDFVQDVLKREIPANIPSQCNRGDNETEWKSDEVKKYAEQSCALGLMGIYMQNFKPNKLLDRAEFGTIVSRLLWGDKFNKPNATRFNKFYTNHLEEVKKQNLITKIDNPEAMKELRKWIWTVLKKIDK